MTETARTREKPVSETPKGGSGNAPRVPFLGHRIALLGSVARNVWTGSLYKLNFTVTGYCNSKCVTCDIWKEYPFSKDPDPKELSLAEIETFFGKLPPSLNWLSLTGGEPHARKDFPEIVGAAIRRIPNLHLVGIPSNGLLSDRTMRLVESLVGRPHPLMFLSFSMDGPEAVHDRVRGVPGGFKKTWETYEAVREAVRGDPDFVVSLETTVSSQNVGEISPFLAETIDAGHLLTITIGHNAYLYTNAEAGKESMSPARERDRLASVIGLLKGKAPWWRPKGHIDWRYLDGVLKFAGNPARQVVPCTALKSSVSVDALGHVHPCLMWGEPLGSLREHDYDIMPILAGAATREARKKVKEEKCPNCWTPCEAYQGILGRLIKPL